MLGFATPLEARRHNLSCVREIRCGKEGGLPMGDKSPKKDNKKPKKDIKEKRKEKQDKRASK